MLACWYNLAFNGPASASGVLTSDSIITAGINGYAKPTATEVSEAITVLAKATRLVNRPGNSLGDAIIISALPKARARALATMNVGAKPSAADIADAVWNRNLGPFIQSGSAGLALTNSGEAGNPWSADLASNNTPGTFGNFVQKLLTVAKFLGLK